MNKRKTGSEYEQKAAEYLEAKGMRIIARNFRIRSGEIDLIARDGRYLVFTEVKYRRDSSKGDALEAVDIRKQRAVIATARYFLHRYRFAEDTPCRFDVIGITDDEITHVQNAFWME